AAYDAQNGVEVWQTPSPLSLEGVLRQPGMKVQAESWFDKYKTARSILFENQTLGTLSSDGQLVFPVEHVPLPPMPDLFTNITAGIPRHFGTMKDHLSRNRLRALDLETRAVRWETPPGDKDLGDLCFLGPPLPLAGRLYAVGEKAQEIKLVCLRA